MGNKIHWVDSLKFIGILAVILGHMNSPLSGFIYSFHMPLFFMLSGFFLRFDSNPQVFFRKNFLRLMIPYFLFSFLGLVVEIFKRVLLHRPSLDLGHELKGILWDMNYSGLQNHYGFVLWFLPALFFAKQILFFIQKYLPSSLAVVATAVVGIFVVSFYIHLPFGMDLGMNALFWVWIGQVMFHFYQKDSSNKVILILGFLLLIQAHFFEIPFLDMALKAYVSVPFNISWVLLLVSLLVFSLKMMDRPFGKKWASETMFLFIFHPYTNNVAHLLVERFNPDFWLLKFLISVLLLGMLLMVKKKFKHWRVFQYV